MGFRVWGSGFWQNPGDLFYQRGYADKQRTLEPGSGGFRGFALPFGAPSKDGSEHFGGNLSPKP